MISQFLTQVLGPMVTGEQDVQMRSCIEHGLSVKKNRALKIYREQLRIEVQQGKMSNEHEE